MLHLINNLEEKEIEKVEGRFSHFYNCALLTGQVEMQYLDVDFHIY